MVTPIYVCVQATNSPKLYQDDVPRPPPCLWSGHAFSGFCQCNAPYALAKPSCGNDRCSIESSAAIPAALFTPKIHPRVDEVVAEVDAYFLERRPFQNEKAQKKFVAAGFSLVTCLYFSAARDDRIALACRLLALPGSS